MSRVLRRMLRPWLGVEWLVLRAGLFPRPLADRPHNFPRRVRLEARLFGTAIGQLDIIAVEGERPLLCLALPQSALWRRIAAESLAEAFDARFAAWPRCWESVTWPSARNVSRRAAADGEDLRP